MRKNLIPLICKSFGVREGEKFELYGGIQGFTDEPLLCKLVNDNILIWNVDSEKWEELRGTFVDALTGKDSINRMDKKENREENKMVSNTRKNGNKLVLLTDILTLKFKMMLENYASEKSNFLLSTMLTLIAKYNSKTSNFKDIYNDIKAKRDDINVVKFGYSLCNFNVYKKSTQELFLRIDDNDGNTVSLNFEADLDPSAYKLEDVQLCVIASLSSAIADTLTSCRDLDAKLRKEREQIGNMAEETVMAVVRRLFEVKTISLISIKLHNGDEVTFDLSDKQSSCE